MSKLGLYFEMFSKTQKNKHIKFFHLDILCIQILHWRRGGGGRGARPPTRKKGASTLFAPPPTFHGSPLSALPSVYQFISCHTLFSTALALVCVRGYFRVLENEQFSTPCEGEPLPHPPQLGRSAPSYVCPPTFKYVATPMY